MIAFLKRLFRRRPLRVVVVFHESPEMLDQIDDPYVRSAKTVDFGRWLRIESFDGMVNMVPTCRIQRYEVTPSEEE